MGEKICEVIPYNSLDERFELLNSMSKKELRNCKEIASSKCFFIDYNTKRGVH